MPLSLNIGKCTLLGNYRENNEDSIDVKPFPDMIACIVADGMGGQAAGEIASKRAIEVVPRELRKNLANAGNEEQLKQVVRKAVMQANEEIITMGTLDRELKNMGTTIVLALWRKGRELYIANLGDSRAYLIRAGTIEQLTTDHSLAQALVENKTISAEEAKVHRWKNHLWKYLGSKENGEGPEVKPILLEKGDRVLLCTDGLTGPVPDEKLLEFIDAHPDVQECADGLGQLALDMGSRDNVSCILIEAVEG
ncbi:MAG: serine/threonine-protein phosphatase [Planctomycetes bacterium]|nr:serine/threonine-protein phosphatase [Planctomycetota bacterium]